jgi:hypothetical protein
MIAAGVIPKHFREIVTLRSRNPDDTLLTVTPIA